MRPRHRHHVRTASLLGLSMLALSGCAVQASPTALPPEQTPSPLIAEYCRDLADSAVLDATREASTDISDIVNDAITLCQDQPDLAWSDALVQAASEPEPALSSLKQVFPIIDKQGYTFDLAVDFRLLDVTEDPINEAPGSTAASRSATLTMTLTNTTPQRDITFQEVAGVISPFDYPTFRLAAVYSADSPACTLARPQSGDCEWLMGYGQMQDGLTLSAKTTYPLTVGGGQPGGGAVSSLFQQIPEASWKAVQESLSHPAGYKILYTGGDGSRFPSVCNGYSTAPTLISTTTCEPPES